MACLNEKSCPYRLIPACHQRCSATQARMPSARCPFSRPTRTRKIFGAAFVVVWNVASVNWRGTRRILSLCAYFYTPSARSRRGPRRAALSRAARAEVEMWKAVSSIDVLKWMEGVQNGQCSNLCVLRMHIRGE